MKKRIIGFLLACVMMLTLLPTMAFASTTTLKVTANKTKVNPGDTVTFTVSIGAVEKLRSLEFVLDVPAGMTYVANSAKTANNLKDTLGTAAADWTELTKKFTAYGDGAYTNSKDTVLLTFNCTVDTAAGLGSKNVTIKEVVVGNSEDVEIDNTVSPAVVTVEAKTVAVTSVAVSSKTLNLEVGQTRTLTATVTPDNATDKTVTWTSSDKNVATVDKDNGTVTAVGEGTATITATAANGKKDTCKVTVTPAACAHTDKTLVPKEESTCMKQGHDAYYTCDKCHAMFDMDGKVITKIPYLPLAAHKLTKIDAVPATCTEDGTEAYWTCSVCKKMFADKDGKKEIKAPVKVAALGHDIGEKTLETAGVAGSKLALYSATCKTCDKKVYTAMLEMPDNTLNVVAKQSDNSKKDFSKAVSFTLSTSKFLGAPVFTIDPVTADIVTAAKTKAGYKVAGKIDKADYLGAIAYELPNYYDTAEEAYAAMAAFMKDGLTFTQKISAKENTWAADAKSHTMTFDINTADGTFTVKVDGKNESTNTFTYKTVSPGGGGNGGSTTTDTTKTDGKKVESGKTFDAGIAMYVGLSVLSVTGGALVIGKKKERF